MFREKPDLFRNEIRLDKATLQVTNQATERRASYEFGNSMLTSARNIVRSTFEDLSSLVNPDTVYDYLAVATETQQVEE